MTRVSKKRLAEKDLSHFSDVFNSLVIRLNTKQKSEIFLTDFLTAEEKIMITKRLIVFIMLTQKYTPIEIQSALNVSYETVRTYKIQLRYKSDQFLSTLSDLAKQENTKKLLEAINTILHPLELILQAKTNSKARAKLLSGDLDKH